MLSSDPRGDDPDWRSALEGLRHLPGLSEDSLAADKSPLGEELNVLYAGKGMQTK